MNDNYYPRLIANVRFKRLDGRVVEVQNALIDTIGVNEKGIVMVETNGDPELVHVPFVESWSVLHPF